MVKIRLLFTSVLFALLAACGGGGGGDTSSTGEVTHDTNTSFKAYSPLNWTPGSVKTFNLSGTDTLGGTYTGSTSIAKRHDTVYLSQSAAEVQVILQLTDNFGDTLNIDVSGYTSSVTGFAIGSVNHTTGVVCTVTNAVFVDSPANMKDGDFGTSLSQTCTDNLTSASSWRASLDSTTGNLKIISSATVYNISNVVVGTTDTTVYIDTQGMPHRMDMRIHINGGITINVSSN